MIPVATDDPIGLDAIEARAKAIPEQYALCEGGDVVAWPSREPEIALLRNYRLAEGGPLGSLRADVLLLASEVRRLRASAAWEETGRRGLDLWFDGLDFVVASDPSDADEVWEENHHEDRAAYVAAWAALVKPWARYAEPTLKIEGEEPERRTPAEWVSVKGRGYLCSINPEFIG